MDRFSTSLENLADREFVEQALAARSSSLDVPSVGARITGAARHLMRDGSGNPRAVATYAPGRIEFLGKHTDYAGGQSLTCAVQRAFCMVAIPSDRPGLTLEDMLTGTKVFIPYSGTEASKPANWVRYPDAVTRRIVSNFGQPEEGISLVFGSDIPRSSGMSSSSALVVGIWLCSAALASLGRRPAFKQNLTGAADLAEFLGCVENGAAYRGLRGDTGVGTKGGAQDHTAILFSKGSQLGHYGYRPLRRMGNIMLPDELTFLVASSGVHAAKASGALKDYNNAVTLAERGVGIWTRASGEPSVTLEDVVSSPAFSLGAFERLVYKEEPDRTKGEAIVERTRQYVLETREIIPEAISAMASRAYDRLGEALEASQRLADVGLKNQVPETTFLVDSARQSGALAASAFGAGFGGAVYAVVPKEEAESVLRRWIAAYGAAFSHRLRLAHFFSDPTGRGAFVLGADPAMLLLEPQL